MISQFVNVTVVIHVADGTKKRKGKGSAFQTISAVHRVLRCSYLKERFDAALAPC